MGRAHLRKRQELWGLGRLGKRRERGRVVYAAGALIAFACLTACSLCCSFGRAPVSCLGTLFGAI